VELDKIIRKEAIIWANLFGSITLEPSHILAAIRGYRRTEFSERYPDLSTRLDEIVANSRGSRGSGEPLSQAVEGDISQFINEDSLWRYCDRFQADFISILNNSPQSAESNVSNPMNSEDEKNLKNLISKISELTQINQKEIEKSLEENAMKVIQLTSPNDSELELIRSNLRLSIKSDDEDNSNTDVIEIIKQLSTSDQDDSRQLAKSFAESVLGIVENSIKHGETASETDNGAIDHLKLLLQQALGPELLKKSLSKSLDIFDAEFEDLVGLDSVKQELRTLVRSSSISAQTLFQNNSGSFHSMHLAFLGAPGTGKTEVARTLGKVLHEQGILSKGHFVEVSRSDFISEHVGGSEARTNEIVRGALGGVLFIDEAYSILDSNRSDGGQSFGLAILDALVLALENYRKDFVVILAGYEKEMERLFNGNPGLRSRIPNHVRFQNYSIEEMLQIASKWFNAAGYSLSPEALIKFEDLLKSQNSIEEFGNARGVRNLVEAAIRERLSTLIDLGMFATVNDKTVIQPQDLKDVSSTIKYSSIGYI